MPAPPLPTGAAPGLAADGRSRKKHVTVRGKPETRVRIKLAE